ncbi:uncharacterized protein LOC109439475 isoform X4 [Rhinolophus sinicus]|uniref:uncharacterized protein LOC109439475 isoform X4 n=1 Tax=Rhinolophus sinicus TaxID=89399 RepID=UPI003D7A3E60
MATCSTITPVTDSWEKRLSHKKEELNVITEPTHYFIHRMMSSSSYSQEDLISSASEPEDYTPESSQEQKPEYSDSIKKLPNPVFQNKDLKCWQRYLQLYQWYFLELTPMFPNLRHHLTRKSTEISIPDKTLLTTLEK